jgi:hypothetical protein
MPSRESGETDKSETSSITIESTLRLEKTLMKGREIACKQREIGPQKKAQQPSD